VLTIRPLDATDGCAAQKADRRSLQMIAIVAPLPGSGRSNWLNEQGSDDGSDGTSRTTP
jgi:hypothetical protein